MHFWNMIWTYEQLQLVGEMMNYFMETKQLALCNSSFFTEICECRNVNFELHT